MSRSSRSRPRLNTDRLLLLGVAILELVVSAIYFFLQKTEDFSWPYLTNSVLLSFLSDHRRASPR